MPDTFIHGPMEYTESFFPERRKIHYTLSSDRLSIAQRSANVTLQLKGLEPDYQIVRRRSPGFYVGLIGLAVALVLELAARAGFPGPDVIEDPHVLAMVVGSISLLCVVTSFRSVELAEFRSTMGPDVLSIARSGPDGSTFHQFVEELSRRIQQVHDGRLHDTP